jgi:hemolysin activation/secretion protein
MGYECKKVTIRSRYTRTAGVLISSAAVGAGAMSALGQEGEKKDQPGFVMPSPNRGQAPSTEKPAQPAAPEHRDVAPASAAPADPEKPAYLVGAIVIRYALDHPSLPAIDDLLKREVTLGKTDDGYVAAGGGVREETISIEDVSLQGPQRWSSRALYAVSKAILDEMNKGGVIGVTVTPIDTEFAPPGAGDPQWGKDLRKPGQSAVTLLVKVGLVREMRTIAFGERIPFERRINAEEHQRILDGAPVHVFQPDDPEREDVLRKDELDDYVFRLNRHPGRRVDLAVAAAQEPGGIALDLLINENKPWLAYFQVSNTGTESTRQWRERFGYQNNQLTGHDDIFSVDYTTAGFEKSHALIASYERPVWSDSLRARVFASWNEFTASDVGLGSVQDFKGDGYSIGAELIATVFQKRELFVDVVAGARYQSVSVSNNTPGVETSGRSGYFLPSLGARMERNTDTSSTNVRATVEFNLSDVGGTNDDTTNNLGRLGADKDWTTFQWDVSHSFYLDPLIFGDSWHDTSTAGHATLAHEIAISFRGQHAFEHRLIPTFQQVVGGLYTVRGYPESVVSGDTVVVVSGEYRLHVPQAFGYDPNPGTLFGQSFRWQPQQPYGRADWDLITRGFIDAGKTINSHRESYERDETLVGAGFGFEFLYKRNLSIRADFGWALEDAETGDKAVTSGSSRLHFVATLLF